MFFLEHNIMSSTLVANKLLCFSVFTGRENSFSVSFANPILTIPELFSLMDLRAADQWRQLALVRLHSLYYLIKGNLF